MNLELKKLSRETILQALEKAERYRFLNEPSHAESICLDVLILEPNNQKALITLLLCLTDQFGKGQGKHHRRALEIVANLESPYHKAYYTGIIAERKAKSTLEGHFPGAGFVAYDLFMEALGHYAEAEKVRPPGNDDALLRWNTCVRLIERHKLSAEPHDPFEQPLE